MESDEALAARRVGETVGRYRLERVLGVGGMAAVYAGHAADGSWAAIKLLHPEMSVRRDVRERFYREGYVANSIQHPGVVFVLEHGDAGPAGAFLAMELLQGETLTERVRRHGTLPVPELLEISDQVLDVLRVAHEKGVVHRDLKPDNLFVTYNGQIKILDFGLARLAEGAPGDHRTRSGVALGTLPYMAPEQALGRRAEIDGRVDLFALGATLFRILAGRKIHEGNSEAELLMAMASKPAPPLASVCPQLPADLCKIVDLALAFSRDARYPNAALMQADVRAFRAGAPPPYAHARWSQRDEKTRAEPAFDPSLSSSTRGPQGTLPLAQYPFAGALSSPAGPQLGQTFPSASPNAQPIGLGQTYPSAGAPPATAAPSRALVPLVAAPLAPTPSPQHPVPNHLGQTYPSAGTPSALAASEPRPASKQAPTATARPIVWALGFLGVLVSLGIATALWRSFGAHVADEAEQPATATSAVSALGASPANGLSAGIATTAAAVQPLEAASAVAQPLGVSGAPNAPPRGSVSAPSRSTSRVRAPASASPATGAANPNADRTALASPAASPAPPPAASQAPAPAAANPATAPAPAAAAPAPVTDARTLLPRVRGRRNSN